VNIKRTTFWGGLDHEIKGHLDRRSAKGVNRALNIRWLHAAFGTDDPDALICEMGEMLKIPAFMKETSFKPKRYRRGAPTTTTLLFDKVGIPTAGIPTWATLEMTKRLSFAMKAMKEKSSKRISARHWARNILKQEFILGWPNPFIRLNDEAVEPYARSVADHFDHPTRLLKQQAAVNEKMEHEFPDWQLYKPVLYDLFPFYFSVYLYNNDASVWGKFTKKCADTCVAMSIIRSIIEEDEDLRGSVHARINIQFSFAKEGRSLGVFNFSRLPSFVQFARLIDEPDGQFSFNWAPMVDDHPDPDGLEFLAGDLNDGRAFCRVMQGWFGEHAIEHKGTKVSVDFDAVQAVLDAFEASGR